MSGYMELPAIVYCIILCVALSSSLPYMEYGVVYANNGTFRFVGETVELYCNITNKDLRENSSMLHIERITKIDQNIVPVEYIEILTTKAIRLRLRQLSVDDDGVYTCFQETFSGESRVIGSETIKVDNPPARVKDVSCRVYNWEQMKCTWRLAVKYLHPEFVKVSLVWTIHGEQQDCPKLTNTSCLWDSKTYKHGHRYLMVVEVATVVEGKELMHARSPQIRIDTVLFVEPAPVNNLQATVESSSCVYLTWQHSSGDWQKFFVAESRVKDTDKWNQIILNQEQDQEDYHSAVCHLKPFTDYEFRMSVLPFPVETAEPVVQGYKSEWKMVSAQTLEDVPAAAPKICSGCFHDYKCPQRKLHRCVRIYWQSLTEGDKGGILTTYNITYSSSHSGELQTLLLPVSEPNSQLSADLELPTNSQSFKVLITPGTSQGFSKSSSTLYLPPALKKPSAPLSFLVERDEFDVDEDMRFYLSWAALNVDHRSGHKYTNVSVVWCCGRRQEAVCQSSINWIKLPADHVTYELWPEESDCHYDNFLIGISAETFRDNHVTSSGIHWSSCVYYRNQKPKNTPKNVRQSSSHPTNGLTIQWDKSGCKEEKSFITEYLVIYCPLYEDNTCVEAEKSLNISNTFGEVTLNHLKEDVRYKVNVIAVSSAGLGPIGPLITQAVKGSPLPVEPEMDKSIGIIVGIVSFMIFLGLLVAFWRYCFYWRKTVPNTENLIQPYAQSSENYSAKKLQDIRNRPLPKTPEDQHFYGSSACMNILGSEKIKNNRHSESCSEESSTSQTELLLKLSQSNHGPLTSKRRAKLDMKKNATNKISKKKSFPVREIKTLLDLKPSMRTNESNSGLNVMKNPHLESDPSFLVHHSAFELTGSNLSNASDSKSGHLLNIPNTVINILPSSRASNELKHAAIGDFGDSQPEKTDPRLLHFSQITTLSLRRHSMELPYYPGVRTRLQTFGPFLPSSLGSHEMALGLGQSSPATQYKSSTYSRKNQPRPPQIVHYTASTRENLQTSGDIHNHTSHLAEDFTSDRMARSNLADGKTCFLPRSNNMQDYCRTGETPESKRHSVPLEYVLHFPPQRTCPPPPCPEDVHFTSSISSSPYSTSPGLSHHYCQCPLSLGRSMHTATAAQTPFVDRNNHLHHQQFLSTVPHPAMSAYLSTTPTKERIAQSPFNLSPPYTPTACVDYLPHIRSFSNEGLVDNSQYSPTASAHTFPRNPCKDAHTLQLPSLITRPLSGDLLDLPPEYYQDPQLGGSNQILTEL